MRWLIAFALTGCYQPSSLSAGDAVLPDDDAPIGDGPPPIDSPLAENCAGMPGGLLPNTCFAVVGPKTVGAQIDTDGTECDPTQLDACFIVGKSLTIGANVTVTGTRPLVLWSASSIVISGSIDVASHQAGRTGPSANPGIAFCPQDHDGGSQTGSIPGIGGGGGGGSYATAGGSGAQGATTSQTVSGSGTQSTSGIDLHGGCRGGSGGLSPGNGGDGGGAIYVMARNGITITGSINASGAGGGAGTVTAVGNTTRGGGGGGGAGGLIALDSFSLDLGRTAHLVALGGGGGSGAANNPAAVVGKPGKDPTATGGIGAGGLQTTVHNNGGNGSGPAANAKGENGNFIDAGSTGGGGGGGGGAGYIVRYGPAGTSSGAPVIVPPIMILE